MGDKTKAAADRQKSAELHAYESGLNKENKGDYDGAIVDFTKAIQLNPRSEAAYFARAKVYDRKTSQKGNLDKAAADKAFADFTKVIELNPKSADSYFYLGMAAVEEDKQIANFTKAIEIKPDYAMAYKFRRFGLCK